MTEDLIILFLYFVFSVSAFGYVILKIRGRLEIIFGQPIYLFIAASGLIYGLVPLLKKLHGIQSYPFSYSFASELLAFLLIGIYIFSCLAAYTFSGGLRSQEMPLVRPLTMRERRRLFFIVGVPSLLAMAHLIFTIGSYDFAEYMKDRIMVRRGMGPVVVVAFASVCYGSVLLVNYLSERQPCRSFGSQLLLAAGVGLLVVIFFTAIGNRNFAFIYFSIAGLSVLSIVKVRLSRALLWIPVCLCIALGFSAWAKIRNSLGDVNVNALTDGGVAELLVSGLNGAFGNGENIVWLTHYSDEWEPLYGATVLSAAINPIPRAIWPNKPFGGGPALRNMIYPGSYVIDGERMTSYTTGAPSEGYMNFGVAGMMLFGLVNGVLLSFAKNVYQKRSRVAATGVVIYTFTVFMLAFGFLYMEILGGWSRYLMVSLLMLFVAKLGDRRVVFGQRGVL